VKDLSEEALEQVMLLLRGAVRGVELRIASRPTQLFVSRRMLRSAVFIMRGNHAKHMIPTTQRKALKRAKARQHMSFITPRWAI
jgi:hypothetical protein